MSDPKSDEDDRDQVPQPPDFILSDDFDANGDVAAPSKVVRSPERELAKIVLAAAMPDDIRRRLLRGEPLAIVVEVPGPDWCKPVGTAVDTMLSDVPNAPVLVHRDGSSRHDHKPTKGDSEVSFAAAAGRACVGVSQNPSRFLPAALISLADAYLVVRPPNGAGLRRLLRSCSKGRVPTDIPDGACSGLSYHEIVGAFRRGASASRVLAKLVAASKAKSRSHASDVTPPLEELPGYPAEARDWGFGLASGIASWRRGEVAWRDLSTAALLYGPPGTGKTLFARALAKSCGLSFVGTSVSAWFCDSKGDLGDVVIAAQRSWDSASAARPALYFVDEIDGLPDRARLDADRLSWWGPVVDSVLTLFDGVTSDRTGIVILAATNHIDRLDAALMRPGRLERHIEILPPDEQGLADVLRHHLGDALPGADLVALERFTF